MGAMRTLARGESCSYQNSLIQLILACSLEWGKKVVSTCLTEIRWASSTDIQVPSNVVLRKNHVPISIKSCRNSLRARQVAFSVFLATGSGLLRVDNWSTSVKQEIT